MRQIFIFLSFLLFVACNNTYHINLKTEDAMSLKMDSKVKHSGIVIGNVSKMQIYGNSVLVQLAINKKYKIPKHSSFYLSTDLLGNGSINVTYNESQSSYMSKTDTGLLSKEIITKTDKQKKQDSILWLNMKKLLELAKNKIDTIVSKQ